MIIRLIRSWDECRRGRDFLLWLIAHTEWFFPGVLIGLLLVVELGFLVRRRWPGGEEVQPAVEGARDGLRVLLGLLLGFSIPMALPHYEERTKLVTDEANAVSTVAQRARTLPEANRERVLQLLREYVDVRLEYAGRDLTGPSIGAAFRRSKQLQSEMWEQTLASAQQNLNVLTPTMIQAVGQLGDLIETRRAASEKHIPIAIWDVFLLIPAMTCFVVGYSMRHRVWLGMVVVPLMVAIVLSMVSELDNSRTGIVRVSQQSMLRVQQDLKAGLVPGR
jgi:hypothetical protein